MLDDREFGRLLEYLERPWSGYRKVRKGVKKRIRRHMEKSGCRTMDAYLELLQISPKDKADCEECLLVTISRFFRDAQLWQYLQAHLLPELVHHFEPPLRFWSAGCACGEEPYSLAMIWDCLGEVSPPEILATDTRTDCLNRAKAGRYPRSSLREVPENIRSTYFNIRRRGGVFSIQKQRLLPIQWQRHHLLEPPPAGPFHIVFLRNNLLTYYQEPQLQTTLRSITSVLAPDGRLVIGSHEKISAPALNLQRQNDCPWIYRMKR